MISKCRACGLFTLETSDYIHRVMLASRLKWKYRPRYVIVCLRFRFVDPFWQLSASASVMLSKTFIIVVTTIWITLVTLTTKASICKQRNKLQLCSKRIIRSWAQHCFCQKKPYEKWTTCTRNGTTYRIKSTLRFVKLWTIWESTSNFVMSLWWRPKATEKKARKKAWPHGAASLPIEPFCLHPVHSSRECSQVSIRWIDF